MFPLTILLITGDADIERALLEAARRTGRTLTVIRTAHEAVKTFTHGFESFSLIILDLDPDVHGVTLFHALDDCHGGVPVVVLTGCEESYVKPIALSLGAADCLGKPVPPGQFARLLDELAPSISARSNQ
jgi:DNA-binding response OmpR family regulator